MGRPPVAQAAADGAHLASVAAEPCQVRGGVFGPDVGFGGQHRFLLGGSPSTTTSALAAPP